MTGGVGRSPGRPALLQRSGRRRRLRRLSTGLLPEAGQRSGSSSQKSGLEPGDPDREGAFTRKSGGRAGSPACRVGEVLGVRLATKLVEADRSERDGGEVVHLKGPFEAIEDHRMEGDTHHDSRTIGGNRQVSSAAMIRSLVWPDARARAAMKAAWRRDSTRASRQPQPATRQVRVVGL